MGRKKTSMNLSFSGCGFLGVYHVGVVSAFREHAPEVLDNKISGCSAGALVAACAICNCCLGEMCSDALEIAVRARSRPLGPFYPTFAIVPIIRNGLRRILPPNAHEICSGRLHISMTRWRDKTNVIINQFNSREELIQALICSSFVPAWSGLIPPKYRDEYHWDGGLTNNSPAIDEHTIIISPFAGESDICPREESGSFYSVNFHGTDVACTQENILRVRQALFPPEISVLKQICLNGYNDGLKFLQSRNMIQKSSFYPKTSISSVLGENYTEPAFDEEKELANGGIGEDLDDVYDQDDEEFDSEQQLTDQSDEERIDDHPPMNFSSFCEKVVRKKDLPTSLFTVFAAADQEKQEDMIRQYFMQSRVYKTASFVLLPITISYDVTSSVAKKFLGYLFSSKKKDEDETKSTYHGPDCICTESRHSSVVGDSCTVHHVQRSRTRLRRRRRQRTNQLSSQDSNSEKLSTTGSTSSQSEPRSDDDDTENMRLNDPRLNESYSSYRPTMFDIDNSMELN